MLNHVLTDRDLKEILSQIGSALEKKVLQRITEIVKENKEKPINNLSTPLQNTLARLAERHSKLESFFGAVLPNHKSEDILRSPKDVRLLLEELKKHLLNAKNIQTRIELLRYLKSVADVTWCYFEFLDDYHSQEFKDLKNMLWPTPEEFDVRLTYVELGQGPQLAKTFGISAEAKDFSPAHLGEGMNSGKSVFGRLDMKTRFEVITKQFDELCEQHKGLLSAMQELQVNSNKVRYEMEALQKEFSDLKSKDIKALAKMLYYKIPVVKDERKPLSEYAQKYELTFQKYAKLADPERKQSLPLLASVSGSTARIVVTLQDLGLFYQNGIFDFTRAQKVMNCLMGFYVFCGHHSFSEVAEEMNRLFDYILIFQRDKVAEGIIPAQPSGEKYMEASDCIEKKVPYYAYGNYASFLHRDFVDLVWPQPVPEEKQVTHRM